MACLWRCHEVSNLVCEKIPCNFSSAPQTAGGVVTMMALLHPQSLAGHLLRPSLNQVPSPWEDGGLSSLVSKKHSLAMHQMPLKMPPVMGQEESASLCRASSSCQELVRPFDVCLSFTVTTLCEVRAYSPVFTEQETEVQRGQGPRQTQTTGMKWG